MFVSPSRPITPAQAARVLTQAKKQKARIKSRAFHDAMADKLGIERIRWPS